MSTLVRKILLRSFRTFGSKKLLKIKAGPNKNLLWNVRIPDSRYILGNYEPGLAKIVESEVKSGKRFIDIGANAGYFSMLASKHGDKNLRHVAIEPFPENIELLLRHLEVNGFDNVVLEGCAIADKCGEIQFSDSGNLAANTYKQESGIFKEKTIKVRTLDLNSLGEKHGLNSDCFLKIDVEGAELDVLKGGVEFLQKYHPTMLLATHDCHVDGVKNACLELISGLGYVYNLVADEKINGQADFLCSKQH